MEQMTEQQFQLWILQHGGEVGRAHNYRTIPAPDQSDLPPSQRTAQAPQRVIDSTTVVARDGAKITVARLPESGQPDQPDYEVREKADTPIDKTPVTPEQQRTQAATAAKSEQENAQRVREDNERSWNQNNTAEGGSGLPETHMERATREAKEREQKRQDEQLQMQRDAAARQQAIDAARIKSDEEDRASREREGAANRGLTQQQIDISRAKDEREAKRPEFLSQADTKNQYITRYDPQSGQIVNEANPNYDAVKAAAEEKRAELASQIAARKMNLEEAQQQYTQWFDTNVKTPLMMAQEQRARAEERRQALEAEERRRQFAADFKLRKATLGETAASRATNAEISLLPYRAGPTESAEMSSAINSLAAGGKIGGPDASAGIHFTPGAFEFNAPDFKKIAKDAAKAVLSGLTDYRPSDQEFETGDYSGIPQVNLSGMPQYQYTPQPLPEPTQ